MLIYGYRCNTEKALSVSLQAIYGINGHSAHHLCAMIGASPALKLKNLRQRQRDLLLKACRDNIPGGLRRRQQEDVKALITLKHYRGVRHMFGLPCHGQRSRTNASTAQKHNKLFAHRKAESPKAYGAKKTLPKNTKRQS